MAESDVVIGAVLGRRREGAEAGHPDVIKSMRPGSVVVDIAIDQGGRRMGLPARPRATRSWRRG